VAFAKPLTGTIVTKGAGNSVESNSGNGCVRRYVTVAVSATGIFNPQKASRIIYDKQTVALKVKSMSMDGLYKTKTGSVILRHSNLSPRPTDILEKSAM
jgi:hypothetical protein